MRWTNQIVCMNHSNKCLPSNERVLEWIAKQAHHGVEEMDREDFVVVIELDPSSSLLSIHLSSVRKLSSRLSKQNGNQLVLAHVASRAYDSEA